MSIGFRLQSLRCEYNFSIESVAQFLDITPSLLNDFEQVEPPHLVEDGDSWVVKSNDFKYTKLSPSSRGFTTRIIIYFL